MITNKIKNLSFLFAAAAFIVSCEEAEKAKLHEINYEMQSYRLETKNCDTAGTCAYVEFNYPLFSSSDPTESIGILNSYISTALLADETGDYASSVEDLGKSFIDEYNSFISDFPEYEIGWALERDINVIYSDPNVISLEFFEYSFMGGAHPNTVKTYQSFKLTNGERIIIEDSTTIEQLRAAAEAEFRKLKNISISENLSAAGYWFDNDEFYLNDNFAVIDEGLVFYFNPYEIAPYALGPTEIVLKGGEINDIVNKIIKIGETTH